MKLNNKSVLITGYGFVSPHLVDELVKHDARITVLDRDIESLSYVKKGVEIIRGDLRHLNKKLEFDYVFHLASVTNVGYSEQNCMETYESNILATINLLKNVKINEKLIFTSSATVYGNQDKARYSEESKLEPISEYGITKALAEEAIRFYAKRLGFNYTICRFFNLYGEGQSKIYIIPQLIHEALNEGKITIQNGKPLRDFVYVKDAVKGLMHFAENTFDYDFSEGERAKDLTVNIGTGTGVSIRDLSSIIAKLTSIDTIIDKEITDNTSPTSLIADVRKAEYLGFHANTSLKDALKGMILRFGD